MPRGRRWIIFGLVSLIIATFCWRPPATAAEPLFASDEILDLTISGPLRSLARNTSSTTAFPGWLELGNAEKTPVVLSKYGISRLSECDLPLFKIDVEEKHARDTPFEGIHSLRLVTPCHHLRGYDRYILLEYLVYKSYAIVAEPALRTRLVSCRFRDTERPDFEETRFAFFVEDIGAAANRHGKQWLDIPSQNFADLDPAHLTVFALFQFMVGNTDWSALSCAEGERCCHNVAVLGEEGDRYTTLLPFDFDQAGLVDAPYAQPDEQLKIRSVTERVYRGFCDHNDRLTAAIELFNDVRPRLEDLFRRDDLPEPKARKRALKYVGSFYDTVNDPGKLEHRIVSDCR
jgi:hypothetical protein